MKDNGHAIWAAFLWPGGHHHEIEVPEGGRSMPRAHREVTLNTARDQNLTMREMVNGFNGLNIFPASAEAAADQFEDWYRAGACDGFILQISHVPEGVDDFVDLVVPLLQQRGVLRTEYAGGTLRENLGLPRPANRYEPGSSPARRSLTA